MKLHNIRLQLFASFGTVAVVTALLAGVSLVTISSLSRQSEDVADEMQARMKDALDTFAAVTTTSEISDAVLQADTKAELTALPLDRSLQALRAAGEASSSRLLRDYYEVRLDYVASQAALTDQLETYTEEIEIVRKEIEGVTNALQTASLARIEAAQAAMLAKSQSSTGRSVDALGTTVNETLESVISALTTRNELYEAQIALTDIVASSETVTQEWLDEQLAEVREGLGRLPVGIIGTLELQTMESALMEIVSQALSGEREGLATSFATLHSQLGDAAENVVFDQSFQLDDYLGTVSSSMVELLEAQEVMRVSLQQVAELESAGSELNRNLLYLTFRFQEVLVNPEPAVLAELHANVKTGLAESIEAKDQFLAMLKALDASRDLAPLEAMLVAAMDAMSRDLNPKAEDLVAGATTNTERLQVIQNLIEQNNATMHTEFDLLADNLAENLGSNVSAGQQAKTVLLVLGSILLGLVALLGFFLPRQISKRLAAIVENLIGMSARLSTSSNAMQQANATQAEASAEQAATLEETSSTLEELASMATKNLEATQKAHEVSQQTNGKAKDGAERMQAMTDAMASIDEASRQISKVTQTIEGIAFQTNILALNAAVEAARAGEAGAGFAVVADEVRALALKCSEAAQETSRLIATNTEQTKEGVDICQGVRTELGAISEGISALSTLIEEIDHASKEQSTGIAQINQGSQEMSQHTQQAAALAQEGASNAAETDGEARSLHGLVIELASYAGLSGIEQGTSGTASGNPATARANGSASLDIVSQRNGFTPSSPALTSLNGHGSNDEHDGFFTHHN